MKHKEAGLFEPSQHKVTSSAVVEAIYNLVGSRGRHSVGIAKPVQPRR